jgi:hypothetical protein
MRCRNFLREAFIDYVITRIVDAMISDSEPQEHETREADIQWNRIVEMELVAHPRLPHPETIEMDYAMQEGVLKVNVRAAVAGYVLRRWNVDCTENHRLKGAEYHLWLRNRQALYGVQNLVLAPGYMIEMASDEKRDTMHFEAHPFSITGFETHLSNKMSHKFYCRYSVNHELKGCNPASGARSGVASTATEPDTR